MFEGGGEDSGACVLKDMSGRQKLMLDLIPAIAYAFELTLVLVSINVWKSYKAKKEFDAQADLEEMNREEHHHQNHESDSSFSGEGHDTHLHPTEEPQEEEPEEDEDEEEEEDEKEDDEKEDGKEQDKEQKLKK